MFRVKVKPGVTISIDSARFDEVAQIDLAQTGNNPIVLSAWKNRLADMYGVHGRPIGNRTSPLDLNAALINNKASFEILSGSEILRIPLASFPVEYTEALQQQAEFKLPAGSTRRRNGVNYVLVNSRWNRADDQTNVQRTKAQRSKDIDARTLKFKDDMENSSETYEQVAEEFIHDLIQMGDRDWAEGVADKIDVSRAANEQSTFLNAIEFYQLTNKDLGVKSIRGGFNRAFAMKESKSIAIPDNRSEKDRKSAQFHEMAHFTEFKSVKIADECKDWVKSRATGELTKLSELTGLDYRDGEKAYPDHFVDPYVGKIYEDSTEVMSIGLEAFASPKALADLYQTDHSHFDLIMKYIRK